MIANCDPDRSLHRMMRRPDAPQDYVAQAGQAPGQHLLVPDLLGLKKDLVRKELGIKEPRCSPPWLRRRGRLSGDHEGRVSGGPGYGLTIYDNVCPGCSPKGKNTINIMATRATITGRNTRPIILRRQGRLQ